MVPGVVLWVARNAGRNPFLVDVVVDVPFVAAGDAALMSPDERFSEGELVDIELESLRGRNVLRVKIDVVYEVMKIGDEGVTAVRNSLRRKAANEVIVPKNIGVGARTADVVLGGFSAHRWRTDIGSAAPVNFGSSRRAC